MTVADSGVGIPTEVQPRIFEPFFTTKGERGTGLGLAMVFGIIERHGGTVTVASEPGHGTTFTLRLPAQPPSSTPPIQPLDSRPGPLLRILAVDDEPALVNLVAMILRSDGHAIITAATGEAALEQIAAAPFDLVISDLGLGAGINGWELAARIHCICPTTRFILATGWGAEIDAAEAHAQYVDAVLAKPYRAGQLRQAIDAVRGLNDAQVFST